MQKLTNCDRAVAMEAPAVPSPKPKMNSGSRAMLSTPPVVMPIIAYCVRPWKRKRLFIAREDIMKGAARKM